MVSVTTWRRVEPRPASEAMTGLQARLADPLWLLGRVWQLGGLTGADAGCPVDADVKYEVARTARWRRTGPEHPDEDSRPYPQHTPVETLVQPLHHATPTPKDRALGGQRFLRFLGPVLMNRYRDRLRQKFPLARPTNFSTYGDTVGAGWDALLGLRSIDGAKLRDALVSTGPGGRTVVGVPVLDQPLNEDDKPTVLKAAEKYVRWWEQRFPATSGAWSTRELAMPFELHAQLSGEEDGSTCTIALTAQNYRGERVDWHTFTTRVADTAPVAGPDPEIRNDAGHLARIRYPGMPDARWWQFEDSAVNMSWLKLGPTDLGKAVLAEIALLDGGDYWDVGLQVEAGSVVAIRSVTIKDSFGDTYNIPSTIEYDADHGDRRRWRMYHADIEGLDNPPVALVVPDVMVDFSESEAREEVHFGPDEDANLVWAREHLVTGPWGSPVHRLEAQRARESDPAPQVDGEPMRYRLSSSLPNHWYPLLPQGDRTLRLERAEPQSMLLTSATPFIISALVVPRTGRRVTMRARRSRGSNGLTYSWRSWRIEPGRQEVVSGLRHDYLSPSP